MGPSSLLTTADQRRRFSEARQVVIVARHGDRHDYANPEWQETLRQVCGPNTQVRDPPLSALGHRQALALTRALSEAERPCTRIVSSPYLRCIQTAVGTARSCGIKLELEAGIAEVWHRPIYVASVSERFRYFPEIDTTSTWDTEDDGTEEQFPEEYLNRIGKFVDNLVKHLDADSIQKSTTLLVSHAASVALVSRLAQVPLDQSLAFAPAGCYVLARDCAGEPFSIVRRGDTNGPYVEENSSSTAPCAMFSSKN